MPKNNTTPNAAREAGQEMQTVYGAQFHGNGHLIGFGYVPYTFRRRAQAAKMIKGLRNVDVVELYEDAKGTLYWDSTDLKSILPECVTGNCQELKDLA